jgi:predicted nucleic-acid-binding protein
MREAVFDANILLHYLTDAPREQADEIAGILETAFASGIALVVTPITMADVVFVLESVCGWERESIAQHLVDLISSSVLQVAEADILIQALSWYREHSSVHFADAYVAAVAATEPPVPQANAYGQRALQVCGADGYAECGFENQGQCVSTTVAMLRAGVDEPIEDENGNGQENGSEEEDGDDAENGDNGAEDENGNGEEEEN